LISTTGKKINIHTISLKKISAVIFLTFFLQIFLKQDLNLENKKNTDCWQWFLDRQTDKKNIKNTDMSW